MATTEVHVLVMHPIGEDNYSTMVFTGWTIEEARASYIAYEREATEGEPEDVWPYSTWEEWVAGEGYNCDLWWWREEVHHLPA